MRTIVIICGVRPQYIKAKALYRELVASGISPGNIKTVDTGQHYDAELCDRIIDEIALPIDLRIKHARDASALAIIAASITQLEIFLSSYTVEKPLVVVFGDANPALSGCLAAVKLGCPVLHVEAGARRDPSEQEHLNSKIIDSVAKVKLCVTERAVANLVAEGNGENTHLSGDMAIRWYAELVQEISAGCAWAPNSPILVTLHRPNNMSRPLIDILVAELLQQPRAVNWILHPRSIPYLQQYSGRPGNIKFLQPLSFYAVLKELSNSQVLITDSGGLAREAVYVKVPVLMRRNTGGWPELRDLNLLRNLSVTAEDIMNGLAWAAAVRSGYPPVNPFYIEGGVEQAIQMIKKELT